METLSSKSGSSKSKSNKTIIIPKELIEKLEALPNVNNRKIVFKELDDAVILKYAKTKTAEALGKILGYSETTINRRVKELNAR